MVQRFVQCGNVIDGSKQVCAIEEHGEAAGERRVTHSNTHRLEAQECRERERDSYLTAASIYSHQNFMQNLSDLYQSSRNSDSISLQIYS